MIEYTNIVLFFLRQEEQNRGKPNWEHLNEELHVLISVEDTENRAKIKMQRAIEEVKKLIIPVSSFGFPSTAYNYLPSRKILYFQPKFVTIRLTISSKLKSYFGLRFTRYSENIHPYHSS